MGEYADLEFDRSFFEWLQEIDDSQLLSQAEYIDRWGEPGIEDCPPIREHFDIGDQI